MVQKSAVQQSGNVCVRAQALRNSISYSANWGNDGDGERISEAPPGGARRAERSKGSTDGEQKRGMGCADLGLEIRQTDNGRRVESSRANGIVAREGEARPREKDSSTGYQSRQGVVDQRRTRKLGSMSAVKARRLMQAEKK
jgi:hypothetical protein